jgi:MFS family permease
MFEWYDFFLAAVAAAAVWPKIFFPAKFDPALALAVSVMSVGLAYLARPVGAIIFGHIGDKYGRRNTLVWTLILMGISSVGTAILPPYASIGMLALTMIFVFRLLVGIGLGGEQGGAFSWVAEARPNSKHRGFWIAWPNAVLTLGKLLSILAFYVVSASVSSAAYLDWGWRIPFALGALMLVIALLVRIKVMESPMFQQLQAKRSVLKYPAFQVMREEWRKIFKLLWLMAYSATITGMLILPYSVSYLVARGVNDAFANLSVTVGTAVSFFIMLTGGYLSDIAGRIKVIRAGAALTIAVLYPYMFLLQTLNPIMIIAGQAMLYPICQGQLGAASTLYVESFATKYRYSGAGITYQLGGMITGILVAVILPVFLITYGVIGSWQPIVLVNIALCLLAIVSTFFLKETRGTALE